MASFLIHFFTFTLLLIGAFIVLVVLMQKPSANAGMGAALGGGAAESAFGGETARVLNKWTIYSAAAFFIISFSLYLLRLNHATAVHEDDALPTMTAHAKAAK